MSGNYRYQYVSRDIRSKIERGEYTDGQRLPTESELQTMYNVSRITVIKALEPLRKEGLIQSFPGKGTFVNLKKKQVGKENDTKEKSVMVGIVMPQIYSYFSNSVLASVAEEANRRGVHLVAGFCYNTVEEETKQIERMISLGCDGVIVIPLRSQSINHGIINAVLKNYPIVVVDRELDGVPLTYVGSDHERATAEAMNYLFELGHKDIGMISIVPKTTAVLARERGYFYGYAMSKHQARPNNCITDIRSSMTTSGKKAELRSDVDRIKEFITENPKITAMLCVNYNTMQICRMALKELGMKIPRDISLICFDAPRDVIAGKEYTYVQQDEKEIGRLSMEVLLKQIQSGEKDAHRYLVPTRLCTGASTDVPGR